jgi:hypothetical protein
MVGQQRDEPQRRKERKGEIGNVWFRGDVFENFGSPRAALPAPRGISSHGRDIQRGALPAW